MQVLRAGVPAAWRTHRLIYGHERPRQHAQAGNAPRIGLELRLDAGDAVKLARDPQIHDGGGSGGANDRRLLQLARKKEVVGAAHDDADAHARTIDLGVAADRRGLRHEIDAFDYRIGRSEADVGRAQRVDREKAHVPSLRLEPFDHLARRVVGHEFDRDAQAPRKLAREVDRDAARLAGRGVLAGEHRVAEVDRRAKLARRRKVGSGYRIHGRPPERLSRRAPSSRGKAASADRRARRAASARPS